MVAGLMALLFYLYQEPATRTAELNPSPEGKFEKITIPMFSMDGLNSGDLTGKILVLNMFASWCVPCEAEHPLIYALAKDHNLPVYGIAVLDKKDKTEAFIKRLGNPYTKLGHDINGLLYGYLNALGVPETLIINGYKKEVIWRHRGPLTQEIIERELLPAFKAQETLNNQHN